MGAYPGVGACLGHYGSIDNGSLKCDDTNHWCGGHVLVLCVGYVHIHIILLNNDVSLLWYIHMYS